MKKRIQNVDAQDRPPVTTCAKCQGEIWHDEPIFQWEGRWICLECFKKAVHAMLERAGAMLENDQVMLAYEMQIEVKRYI